MRHGAGDLEKAEEVDRRAIAILEKAQSTETMLFARLLNNLGIVYIDKEDYERPEELFGRSLAIIGGEALRQAQLAMLTRHERQHPFYRASFIQAGEWATLDGHR